MASPSDLARAFTLVADAAQADGLTVSGGEPFQQPDLGEFLAELRALNSDRARSIVVYSGYSFEELTARAAAVDAQGQPTEDARAVRLALGSADVLVDGRFIRELDDDRLQYRGSRNQRPVDLRATARAGGRVVRLDWDSPLIVVMEDGDALVPIGFDVFDVADLGTEATARRCGQTKGFTP